MKDHYKSVLHEMIDKIDSEAVLVKVYYTFVCEWLKGGAI